jgi:hypothetical protein
MTPSRHTGYSGSTVHVTQDKQLLELWRAAVLVYRRVRADPERKEWQAADASAGAVMQLDPKLNWEEASRIAKDAVAAISARWPDWMWRGDGAPPDWERAGSENTQTP